MQVDYSRTCSQMQLSMIALYNVDTVYGCVYLYQEVLALYKLHSMLVYNIIYSFKFSWFLVQNYMYAVLIEIVTTSSTEEL